MDTLATLGVDRAKIQPIQRPTYSTTVLDMYNAEGEQIGDLHTHMLQKYMYKPLWEYLKKNINGPKKT